MISTGKFPWLMFPSVLNTSTPQRGNTLQSNSLTFAVSKGKLFKLSRSTQASIKEKISSDAQLS